MSGRRELIAWRSRWSAVNAVTDHEARELSPAARLRDLIQLRAWHAAAPVAEWPDDDESEVWARFAKLRSVLCLNRQSTR